MGRPPGPVVTTRSVDDAEAFDAAVRKAWCDRLGPCILDLTVENAGEFGHGGVAAVKRDLITADVPAGVMTVVVELCAEMGVDGALAVRHELVNYKKVMHHMTLRVGAIERDLRQIAALLYCEQDCNDERVGYWELSQILQRCRGCLQACFDVRGRTRAVCCLPRHCDAILPDPPSWQALGRPLGQVRRALEHLGVCEDMGHGRCTTNGGADISLGTSSIAHELADKRLTLMTQVDNVELEATVAQSESTVRDSSCCNDRNAVGGHSVHNSCEDTGEDFAPVSPLATGMGAPVPDIKATSLLALLHARLGDWPEHVVRYAHLCLVGRGIDKALRLRGELARLARAFSAARLEMAALSAISATALAAVAPNNGDDIPLAAVELRRRLAFLQGLAEVVEDAEGWISGILAGRRFAFLAGDGRVGAVPRGWRTIPEALERFEAAKYRFEPRAQRLLACVGWPPQPGAINCDIAGDIACWNCGARVRPLWVHRGACFACSGRRRSKGRCPYRDCPPDAFCPHAGRCLMCEEWSCMQCRLLRLDGEGVAALVEAHNPPALFLDFCQTLATTKRGQAPHVGIHTVQPDLAEVARRHGNVHVVTRNRHIAEIREFLAGHDLSGIPVHAAGGRGGPGKAERIASLLVPASVAATTSLAGSSPATVAGAVPQPTTAAEESAIGVFVDDDISEHLAPELQKLGLCRVLFRHTTD